MNLKKKDKLKIKTCISHQYSISVAIFCQFYFSNEKKVLNFSLKINTTFQIFLPQSVSAAGKLKELCKDIKMYSRHSYKK